MAELVILDQPLFPAVSGDLTISDGQTTILIPDCKLEQMNTHTSPSGKVWHLRIVDRRWRWSLGNIDGWHNQLDNNGKLIPWAVRSPLELVIRCLEELDEPVDLNNIDMPPGLAFPGFAYGLPIINISQVNPPINWQSIPPAQALNQVCEMFGRRVIYQLDTDSILIAKIGDGDDLPTGSIASQGPSIKVPVIPSAVGVNGAPTRYQMRLALEAVGEEWNGFYMPIDLLSYTPKQAVASQVQIATVTIAYGGSTTNLIYDIFLGATAGEQPNQGAVFTYAALAGNTATTIANALVAAISGSTDPRVQGKITAKNTAGVITLTGAIPGNAFSYLAQISGSGTPTSADTVASLLTQPASPANKLGQGWSYTDPLSGFPEAEPTTRLTQQQAQALAEKTVFRYYRITGFDVSDQSENPTIPAIVPGWGQITIRQQIVLTSTQVDQIVPQEGNPNIQQITPNGDVPLVRDFYNGYSRDKPKAIYGSIAEEIIANQYIYNNTDAFGNTDEASEVLVTCDIDAKEQLVIFSLPVYVVDDGGQTISPASIVLQTAVMVHDDTTGQLDHFQQLLPLAGGDPTAQPKFKTYPDIQLNVTSTYDDNGNITNVSILEIDPIARANYYLQGMAAQYQIKNAGVNEYNGLVDQDLDGAIQQVTHSVGSGGARTTISRNSEHNVWVPPYPVRLRAENLPAVFQNEDQRRRVAEIEKGRDA